MVPHSRGLLNGRDGKGAVVHGATNMTTESGHGMEYREPRCSRGITKSNGEEMRESCRKNFKDPDRVHNE